MSEQTAAEKLGWILAEAEKTAPTPDEVDRFLMTEKLKNECIFIALI